LHWRNRLLNAGRHLFKNLQQRTGATTRKLYAFTLWPYSKFSRSARNLDALPLFLLFSKLCWIYCHITSQTQKGAYAPHYIVLVADLSQLRKLFIFQNFVT
jgi:hypothetical protein